jgi:hypothetical protein
MRAMVLLSLSAVCACSFSSVTDHVYKSMAGPRINCRQPQIMFTEVWQVLGTTVVGHR